MGGCLALDAESKGLSLDATPTPPRFWPHRSMHVLCVPVVRSANQLRDMVAIPTRKLAWCVCAPGLTLGDVQRGSNEKVKEMRPFSSWGAPQNETESASKGRISPQALGRICSRQRNPTPSQTSAATSNVRPIPNSLGPDVRCLTKPALAWRGRPNIKPNLDALEFGSERASAPLALRNHGAGRRRR